MLNYLLQEWEIGNNWWKVLAVTGWLPFRKVIALKVLTTRSDKSSDFVVYRAIVFVAPDYLTI